MTPTLWLRLGIVIVYMAVYISRGDSMWLMWLAGMMAGSALQQLFGGCK